MDELWKVFDSLISFGAEQLAAIGVGPVGNYHPEIGNKPIQGEVSIITICYT